MCSDARETARFIGGLSGMQAAARTAVALTFLVALAGCLPEPKRQSNSVSVDGGWHLTQNQACTQHLSLDGAGRFSVAAWLDLGTLATVEQIEGSLASQDTATNGHVAARFVPDSPLGGRAGVYCDQWMHGGPVKLPFASVTQALGIDPLSLVFHPSISPEAVATLVGADGNRRDRLILYASTDHVLNALRADDPGQFPNGIYRALPDDPAPPPAFFPTGRLLPIPQEFTAARYTNRAQGDTMERLLLHVSAGSYVTFSRFPESSTTTCSFAVFADTNFSNPPLFVVPANPQAVSQEITVNPAEPSWPFPRPFVDGAPTYLVPVAVQVPADGDCEAVIQAQSISDRLAALHANGVGSPPVFSVALPAAQVYLLGHRPRLGKRLERIAVNGNGALSNPVLLTGLLVTLTQFPDEGSSSEAQDPLRLAGPSGSTAYISVRTGTDGPSLNIFPSADARTGFGPFRPLANSTADLLRIPDQRAVASPYDGYRMNFRLNVGAQQRIALWTDGGVETSGRLMNVAGRTLALSHAGAADGKGFHIETSLDPGDYWLQISAATGTFTALSTELAGVPEFEDPGLESCLVEAGWNQYPATPLESAWCARRGIRTLTGIDSVFTLQTLDLTGNGLRRIEALQNSLLLKTLLLGGNPLEDITPLGGLPSLTRLSLSATPLTSGALAVLEGLSRQLTVLDLTGVTTLTESQVLALHAAMPFTLIISPAGTPLP